MTHIEKYYVHHHYDGDYYRGDSTSIAECGATGILHANGNTTPIDYNYYLKEAASKADCIPCLQALLERLLGS